MIKARIKHLCEDLEIDEGKVFIHDHHKCHAYYGFVSSSLRLKEPVLLYTMDGGGDEQMVRFR